MKGTQIQLDLQDLSEDEADEDEWAAADAESLRSVRIGDVGEGWEEALSTTRAVHGGSELSLPGLDRSARPSPLSDNAPITPKSEVDEPGSAPETAKSGKSTWRERTDNKRGTVVREGDLGDG